MAEFQFDFAPAIDVEPSESESDSEDAPPTFTFSFGLSDVMSMNGKVSEPQLSKLPTPLNVVAPEMPLELRVLAAQAQKSSSKNEGKEKEDEEEGRRKFETHFELDVSSFELGIVLDAPAAVTASDDEEDESDEARVAFSFGLDLDSSAAELGQTRDTFSFDLGSVRAAGALGAHSVPASVVVSLQSQDDVMTHRCRGRVLGFTQHGAAEVCDFEGYYNRATRTTYFHYADGKPQLFAVDPAEAHKLVPVSSAGVTLRELALLSWRTWPKEWKLSSTVWRHIAQACRENPDETVGVDHFLALCWASHTNILKVGALLEQRIDPEKISVDIRNEPLVRVGAMWSIVLADALGKTMTLLGNEVGPTSDSLMWMLEKLLCFPKVVETLRAVPVLALTLTLPPHAAERTCKILMRADDDGAADERMDSSFWQHVRLLVWLRRKGFCLPHCDAAALIHFLRSHVFTERATAKVVQLLRAKPEDSLLRRLPADVFNYVLLPMLSLPPFEGDLYIPGLTSGELSTVVRSSFL